EGPSGMPTRYAGCNSDFAHHSITPSLHHSITPSLHHSTRPDSRTSTACPTKLVVCRLQTPMASEVGRTKRLMGLIALTHKSHLEARYRVSLAPRTAPLSR